MCRNNDAAVIELPQSAAGQVPRLRLLSSAPAARWNCNSPWPRMVRGRAGRRGAGWATPPRPRPDYLGATGVERLPCERRRQCLGDSGAHAVVCGRNMVKACTYLLAICIVCGCRASRGPRSRPWSSPDSGQRGGGSAPRRSRGGRQLRSPWRPSGGNGASRCRSATARPRIVAPEVRVPVVFRLTPANDDKAVLAELVVYPNRPVPWHGRRAVGFRRARPAGSTAGRGPSACRSRRFKST